MDRPSLQASGKAGSSREPGAGTIHHIALRAANPSRCAAFYNGILGLAEIRRDPESGPPRTIWLRAGDAVLMIEAELRGSGARDGSGHLLAFTVTDLPAWEARLTAAGIPIDDRTEHTLYVRDPEGHRVGLSAHAPAGAVRNTPADRAR